MKVQSSLRARLCGVAFLMVLAAGCGGGGGGEVEPPVLGAPPVNPPAAEVRGWTNTFGSAAVVLGQTAFDQLDPQGSVTPIPSPSGAAAVSADGRLFVGTSNHELLVFNQYDTVSGPAVAFSIQMPSISSVSAQGAKLVVAAEHRVHIFNSAPLDDQAVPSISWGAAFPGCSATTLRQPRAGFLTRMGQLIIADSFNNRVLIWEAVPEDGPLGEPTIVLGQRHVETCAANDDDGDGASDDSAGSRSMSFPTSVWSDGVRLVVVDSRNHRVLIWDTFPTAADESTHLAHHVLGQEAFDAAEPNRGLPEAQATTLNLPASVDVSAAGELAVADTGNNRVLVWCSIPGSNMKPADYVVGQSDFTHSAENDVLQRGVDGTVPSPKTLHSPSGVRFDGRKLIVSDSGNSRVLIWREAD